ncbi:hypothetical protein K469DRAFT_783931, partial [Zopfia rhizophila CBS 207.26]
MAKADWLEQCPDMPHIYRDAALTICAAGSDDCEAGLSTPRIAALRCSDQTSNNGRIKVGRNPLLCWYIQNEPINTRAWCLQEFKLSSRVLFLGSAEMTWYCQAGSLVEGQEDISKTHESQLNEPWQSYYSTLIGNTAASQNSGDELDNLHLWRSIITGYSSRSMSQESDKLPAISAIARTIQPSIGGSLVCVGEQFLAAKLTWTTCTTHQTLEGALRILKFQKPSKYRAPSWPWAAVDGNIIFDSWIYDYASGTQNAGKASSNYSWFLRHLKEIETAAEVLECSIDLAGIDPFGQVTGGHIKLRAPLLKASF